MFIEDSNKKVIMADSLDIESITKEYRELYNQNGAITNVDWTYNEDSSKFVVEVTTGLADQVDEMNMKYTSTALFDPQTKNVDILKTCTGEDLSILIQKYSPSGKYKAVMKASKAGIILEITNEEGLFYRLPIAPTIHLGVIRKSAAFITESIVWSQDETRVMYMADDPKPMLNTFKLKELAIFKYRFEDNPGERVQGHTSVSIFVFDIPSQTLFKIAKPKMTPLSKVNFVMPQFSNREGTGVVCVSMDMVGAYEMSFFTNYPKKIELLSGLTLDKIKQDFLKTNYITPERFNFERPTLKEAIVYYPRISPDLTQCVYLYAEYCKNASSNTFGLRHFRLDSPNQTETIVEPVREDTGLYNGLVGFNFILSSWTWLGNDRVLCSTWTHQTTKIFEMSISEKKVTCVSKPRYFESESHHVVCALDESHVLVRRDTIPKSNLFYVLHRSAEGEYKDYILHKPLKPVVEIEEEEVIVNDIEAVLYGKKDDSIDKSKRSCIVFIHGGPHVVWNNVFHHFMQYHVRRGYAVLNINYTGSAGRGEKFAESLFGRGVKIEAKEIYDMCKQLGEEKKIDFEKVNYFSGSYGGSIGIHILNQYPTFIKYMSLYNPPMDINANHFDSGFPGLALSSYLNKNDKIFDYKETTTDEEILQGMDYMVVQNYTFTTEVLLFTGLKDSVLPRTLNRKLYKKLRGSGLKFELFEYPDEEHIILTPNSSFDFFVKVSVLFQGKWDFKTI